MVDADAATTWQALMEVDLVELPFALQRAELLDVAGVAFGPQSGCTKDGLQSVVAE
jgi:hypothetical protein